LFSRALTSPDGKIRIPINEDAGDSGQIEEYLNIYAAEGIQQHRLRRARYLRYRRNATRRQTAVHAVAADTYFERSTRACRSTARNVARLQRDGILIDGEGVVDGGPHQGAAADLFGERDRADLLRVHPAQGRRWLRRG